LPADKSLSEEQPVLLSVQKIGDIEKNYLHLVSKEHDEFCNNFVVWKTTENDGPEYSRSMLKCD
jgi:hypothetical protein